MISILITGGMGFIGSNFIRYLLDITQEFNVINVDKLTYAGNPQNLKNIKESFSDRYEFFKTDICDFDAINRLVKTKNIEYIINFAAESHVDRSIDNPNIFIETNIMGTQSLLNVALKNNLKKYLQISTDEVYGSLDFEDPPFTENSQISPNSPYSASKASADLLVRSYFKTYGLPVNITRCSNNYGPFQFPEKLIPLMINNALSDRPLPVYGKGINIRDWIHVKDHCAAIYKVLKDGNIGEIYNVGGDSEISNLDLVKTLLKLVKKPESLIRFVKDRPGHDLRYAINHEKITKELGWNPKIKFQDGLKSTVEWYMDNQEWLKAILNKNQNSKN
mgnify:CR=1 FL=1